MRVVVGADFGTTDGLFVELEANDVGSTGRITDEAIVQLRDGISRAREQGIETVQMPVSTLDVLTAWYLRHERKPAPR